MLGLDVLCNAIELQRLCLFATFPLVCFVSQSLAVRGGDGRIDTTGLCTAFLPCLQSPALIC